MIYRKLNEADLNICLSGLLAKNDCPELYLPYGSYDPDTLIGAFACYNTEPVGVIFIKDAAEFVYYDAHENNYIECVGSVLQGLYVGSSNRGYGIGRRLIDTAINYCKKYSSRSCIYTWPLAVYDADYQPLTGEMNRDIWIGNSVYRPIRNELLCLPKYTDVSVRPSNKAVCEYLTQKNFKYVGLNAYDNAPVFKLQL